MIKFIIALTITSIMNLPPPKAQEIPNHHKIFSIDYDISLQLNYQSFNTNIQENLTYNKWRKIPGATSTKIIGIQRILLNQFRRIITHRINSQPYDISPIHYYNNNQWFNRDWMYSLPPEEYGAPKTPIINELGWEIKFKNIPIISWVKHKFDDLGDIWIDVRPEKKKLLIKPKNKYQLEINSTDLNVERPWKWFEDDFYHLRFKPTIKLASINKPPYIKEIAFKMQIELYLKKKTYHFATLNLSTKYNFNNKDVSFNVFIEFLRF